jgi:hypothetical protein
MWYGVARNELGASNCLGSGRQHREPRLCPLQPGSDSYKDLPAGGSTHLSWMAKPCPSVWAVNLHTLTQQPSQEGK